MRLKKKLWETNDCIASSGDRRRQTSAEHHSFSGGALLPHDRNRRRQGTEIPGFLHARSRDLFVQLFPDEARMGFRQGLSGRFWTERMKKTERHQICSGGIGAKSSDETVESGGG